MFQIITLFVIGLLGMPLFAVMAASALWSQWQAGISPEAVIIDFYQLAGKPMLQALPLFSFSGYLLAYSGAPRRLLRCSQALLGWMPGSLAIVAVILFSFMTAFTGASGVTIVALGGLMLPGLLAAGYPRSFSFGMVTSGGNLGLLFAPSLPIILYGVVSETSVDKLFRAGIIPGMLVLTVLAGYGIWTGHRAGVPRRPFDWQEIRAALWEIKWEAPLPVLVIGGIYQGAFTVSEAAVVATAYVLAAEVVIYRDIRVRDIGRIARESVILVGGILIILGMTIAVTNHLIDAEVPTRLFKVVRAHIHTRIAFLLLFNLFLLVVGCMIDIYAAIVLIVPLVIPVALGFGINPIHLGIIFLTNLGIGYSTPPVGMNLFIASIRFREPVLNLYRASIPFILLLLLVLLAVTYIPALSLFLTS